MANNLSDKLLYIGLMSGTSADGIDLALVEFSKTQEKYANGATLIASYYQAYDSVTREKIINLYHPSSNEIDRLGCLNVELARQFSKAILAFLTQENFSANAITAIGCHGQTIRHRPVINEHLSHPFTYQIGCLQTLAYLTGIRVVGDFRTKDMILGGQGAPLLPAFHQALFASTQRDIFVVNIGGIANISFLPHHNQESILGFDTGPGNALMDYWYNVHNNGLYDKNGDWASAGQVCHLLLQEMLTDPYFGKSAPKSTGREYFNGHWLAGYLNGKTLAAVDVQTTLTALTAITIANDIKALSAQSYVYLCGGGIENKQLVSQLTAQLNTHVVTTTAEKNIDSHSLEAMAFAWLALAYDLEIPGNIPSVTGASKPAVLGVNVLP